MSHTPRSEQSSPQDGDSQYRLLLDTLPHGVQENDCEGVITYSNRAHHRILGYPEGELVGKRIWDPQPSAEESEKLREYLAHLVKEQPDPVPYFTTCVRPDGIPVDIQVDWSYRRGADRELTGFISVITDITERRRVENSLRLRTEGLATLLEASKNFVESLELQKILQSTVDGATRLAELDTAAVYLLEQDRLHLWATTPPLPPEFPYDLRAAFLGDHPRIGKAIRTLEPVLIPDIRTVMLTPAEQAVVEQRDLRTVLYLPLVADVRAEGALIVGSIGREASVGREEIDLCLTLANFAALAVKNARLYIERAEYASKLEELLEEHRKGEAERLSLQRQLAQARKLESIGRLAGGVAHDFNNLLTVILGHTEMAQMRVAPSDALHGDLSEIRNAAKRSANLTQQLLAFARKQTVQPKVLDLNAIIDGMVKMLRRLIGESITLIWLPGNDLWQVRVDPAQIEQVLVNLAINARDAITGPGTLGIETRNAVLDDLFCAHRPDLDPGEYALISVSDDGCGMSKAVQDLVFEPFFTTKDPGQGTGLGLSTVYGIVKQNRGYIEIESERGKGSRFNIYLPRTSDEVVQPEEDDHNVPFSRGNETILFVEDEVNLLTLVQQMLEVQGYAVLAATTPADALRLAEEHPGPIDLLLTDVVMPGMNGRQLADTLLSRLPDLKCLFISGYTNDVVDQYGAFEEGVNLVQKPFSLQALSSKIREILDQ